MNGELREPPEQGRRDSYGECWLDDRTSERVDEGVETATGGREMPNQCASFIFSCLFAPLTTLQPALPC